MNETKIARIASSAGTTVNVAERVLAEAQLAMYVNGTVIRNTRSQPLGDMAIKSPEGWRRMGNLNYKQTDGWLLTDSDIASGKWVVVYDPETFDHADAEKVVRL